MNISTFQPYIIELLVAIATAIGSYVGLKIKKIYEEHVNDKTKRQVVSDTCKYVEQLYHDLNGDEKLQKAIEGANDILNEKGIEITDLEIRVLIESTVNGFKEAVNE